MLIIVSTYHVVSVRNCLHTESTEYTDLLHSRSVRMKTFCEFCGFCVRYYFYVTQRFFINVITRITLFFSLRMGTVSSVKSR